MTYSRNDRLGANLNYLASVAISRLQGELAKDGRKPSDSPIDVHKRSGKNALVKSSEQRKGNRFMYMQISYFVLVFETTWKGDWV